MTYTTAQSVWWLVQKDFLRELRALQTLPTAFLIGSSIVMLLAIQIDLPAAQQAQAAAGLLWTSIFFAATLAFERTFASEYDSGCWQNLLLYPMSPAVLFVAKLLVNLASLLALELALIPLFVVLTDVPLLESPGALALITALANVGLAATGTILGALTAGLRHRGGLIALLLLPVAAPVILSAAEATRILLVDDSNPLRWWWIQLLAAFAVVFTAVGALVFEHVMEE